MHTESKASTHILHFLFANGLGGGGGGGCGGGGVDDVGVDGVGDVFGKTVNFGPSTSGSTFNFFFI